MGRFCHFGDHDCPSHDNSRLLMRVNSPDQFGAGNCDEDRRFTRNKLHVRGFRSLHAPAIKLLNESF
jgi:hypothetical protein